MLCDLLSIVKLSGAVAYPTEFNYNPLVLMNTGSSYMSEFFNSAPIV
jgi:hypothetical protein